MHNLDLHFYNKIFADGNSGGNVGWVVPFGDPLSESEMQDIATDLSVPATAFLFKVDTGVPEIRFFSPTGEYGMCGHAIVASMCALADLEIISIPGNGTANVCLKAPPGNIPIELSRQEEGRYFCSMSQRKPWFKSTMVSISTVADLLGLDAFSIDDSLPIETGSTGLTHVFIPVRKLEHIVAIKPDYDGLKSLSQSLGVESVAVFSTDTDNSERDVRIRDFCPAIGVTEEAASGTTNGAVASYLVRHGRIPLNSDGEATICGQQGVEINRPSAIRTSIKVKDGSICEVKVGGGAVHTISATLKFT